MSIVDIILAAVLVIVALCALKNLVRAVLYVVLCAALLCLACALFARYCPDYASGGGWLFNLFAQAGGYVLSLLPL